ncbi:MAG: sigma-70 family RNA polymerase sigma factor, partial [Lysobacterales bacterium]
MTEEFSTSESGIHALLARLRSPVGDEVFARFLEIYSPSIMQIARQYAYDPARLNDCYLFISEKLAANNYHRLVNYQPEGSASFRSWFGVVVANLCIDWRRHRRGRPRLFKSIKKLSHLDQKVFKHRFQQRLSMDTCLEILRTHFPDLNQLQLAGSIARINTTLSPAQMQFLYTQHAKTVSLDQKQNRASSIEPVESGPGPEKVTALSQDQEKLEKALAGLTPHQRLLIKLRFQQDLSLKEIARLTRLGDPF